ncbi:MAG: c-type cytochrome [Gammaproteobacteria bacterium]|nr:c-type cytochrome [Gammaproteobacteria bacterium]
MNDRLDDARPRAAVAIFAAAVIAAAAGAQEPADLVGDADRGEAAYTHEYKCYACHGYDAQTGERRLLPMRYTQEGFITFVQNSPLPQMPAYPDVPAQALADIYAYIRTIPLDAPDVESVPLLKELRDAKAAEFEQ